jgi:Na+:H+ antiporter, NhaA family
VLQEPDGRAAILTGRKPGGVRVARWIRFVLDNSLLLLAGAAAAVIWANIHVESYEAISHPLHFWVNDVAMTFFFALAAKEVFEATLPGGSLASPRRAVLPLAAAVGGMAAPALIYIGLALARGHGELVRGWAIPCATDIAFSAMVARMIFRRSHPAIAFLLLLAIADDALGLVILAVFYPSAPVSLPVLVVLMAAAIALAAWLRHRGMRSFWPYVIGPGALSWAALYLGGFHPALALVPVVPLMPHSARDLGLFEPLEAQRDDTLDRFEHWWAQPVQLVLLLFGFANAGVPFERVGPGTYYVLAALLLGKPIGVVLLSNAARLLGAASADGLRTRDLIVVGVCASVGFTVSLFFATAAFPDGMVLAETKMGALLSLSAAPLALAAAKLLRVSTLARE